MNVTICEKCGTNSYDKPESNIEKLSVRMRQNGSDDSFFDDSIEACKDCREAVKAELTKLFHPDGALSIRVDRVSFQ